MAINKNYAIDRSSNCFRKYRLFVLFCLTVLCFQVYLAYIFFDWENGNRRTNKLLSNEESSTKFAQNKIFFKNLHRLKLPPDKQINANKSQISQRNHALKIKLDLKSLNFTPACEITSKEAISAITRASSQQCKQYIVNTTCLNQQGVLYPDKIQSSCPSSLGFMSAPKNLGCFKDDKTMRLLPGYYHLFKGNNSPEHCAYVCLQSGYPYAGLEYSMECFCGITKPSQTQRLPDSRCNMKCPGNPRHSCGGYLAINVLWTGIQKFQPQEAKNSSTELENESSVRIAYLLTVNGRASRQVKRLINILYHPSHLFYIHVDARQDYLFREMLQVERSCKKNNIIVAKGDNSRQASIWGGASLLTTFLKSAQKMLDHSQSWDFLINLSESDFPIKTNDHLTKFLSWNKGLNFVKSHGREVQRFITKQGLDKSFIECEARMWRVGDRKLPKGIQIDGGSDWVALSRDFVRYVANPNPDSLVSDLLKIFQYTLLPAESFFHTVLRNSKFCNTYVDNNLHVTNWKRKLGCKCQYKAVVDWCGCSPNVFKLDDFTRIKNTAERNLFFARKFEPVIDQKIIDKVEHWLYPKKTNFTKYTNNQDAYWQSLYNYADLSPLTDDALLTVSHSLTRLVVEKSNLNYKSFRLLETTAYFRGDRFIGVLILVEITSPDVDASFRVEGLIHMKKNFSISKSWLGKITNLSVNTDYDQKEQTFRNFMGSLGPHSEPILSYGIDSNIITPQNLTVLWVDPHGKLADINYITIEETNLIGYVKPQLGDYLSVGTWNLLLVANNTLVAKIKFLITPLAYWKNQDINISKSKEINNNYRHKYSVTEETVKKWSSFLNSAIPHEQDNSMGYQYEADYYNLNKWIDTLVHKYYQIDEMCVTNGLINTIAIEKCVDTQWSSLSPDTKADISNLCQKY